MTRTEALNVIGDEKLFLFIYLFLINLSDNPLNPNELIRTRTVHQLFDDLVDLQANPQHVPVIS